MVVLAVPVPFLLFVERLVSPALGQGFSDPQAPGSRVQPGFRQLKTADPAGPRVIVTVPAQRVVYLADEAQGQFPAGRVAGCFEKPEIVADRKRIRPEVPLREGTAISPVAQTAR